MLTAATILSVGAINPADGAGWRLALGCLALGRLVGVWAMWRLRGRPEVVKKLRRRLAASQRVVDCSARAIEGHEMDPCPLAHPLVGRLRCGEWLLFAGVHDMMHLEQLHRLAAELGPGAVADPLPPPAGATG